MNSEITDLFAARGLRVTTPRKAVFETLKKAATPLSQVEIAKINPTIDKVSVYRSIDIFLKLGIVTSVAHGWKQRYELAAPYSPHHHHLLCTACGHVEELQSERLEKIINILADQQKFKVTGHTFEITGLCSKCQTI
ncbi:MAG TPA: Fur family transcriptional regulator [Patescibacteria group bacterium]|jgi:Fur family peroxide stress response transcriptional regulator|nr:Fur family transcriptional regulator [Patescibacteria group bacterium]